MSSEILLPNYFKSTSRVTMVDNNNKVIGIILSALCVPMASNSMHMTITSSLLSQLY